MSRHNVAKVGSLIPSICTTCATVLPSIAWASHSLVAIFSGVCSSPTRDSLSG